MLIACIYLFFHFYEIERTRKVEEVVSYQKIQLKLAVKSFEALFSKWSSVLLNISNDENIVEMNEKGETEIKQLVELFRNEIKGITRIDKKGIIIYSFPQYANTIGADISDQKHIKQILRTKEPVVSDVFDAVQGFNTVAIHYPVFKNGVFKGTIAFVLDFEKITSSILDEIKIGDYGYAWMLSGEGRQLYCPVPEHIGEPIDKITKGYPSFRKLVAKMLSGQEGIATYRFKTNAEDEISLTNWLNAPQSL
jgi:hypothetical protein